jgi:hypothetical protein
MEKIKILIFDNGTAIISEVEEVDAVLGDPDWKLIKPFIINSDSTLSPWLSDYSSQDTFLVHSDKFFTVTNPKEIILGKYQNITK